MEVVLNRSKISRSLLSLFIVAVLASSAPAIASEIDGTASSSDKYWVVGLTFDESKSTRFKDSDCRSQTPAALYGCGTGNDGAPLSTLGDFGSIGGMELGVGIRYPTDVRLEAAVQHYPGFDFSGEANFVQLSPTDPPQVVTSNLSMTSAMVAGYLDFPWDSDLYSGRITPYIGAGFGFARIKIGESRMRFPRTSTYVPGNSQTNPVKMAAIGVSADLSDSTILDISFRYSDFGRVKTGVNSGRVEFHASDDVIPLSLAETSGRLKTTGIRITLRIAM